MDKDNQVLSDKLIVYFEDPFWVGVFERVWNGSLTVCKVTFGPEPKDYEIQEFILKKYDRLKFSPIIDSGKIGKNHVNPKRLQRDVKKLLLKTGIGTKSQQALKLQQEERKTERKVTSRQQRLEKEQRLFELKQQKRKQKHKGR